MSDGVLIKAWIKVNELADHLAPRIVSCAIAGTGIGVCHSHIQGKPMAVGTLPFVAVGAFGGTAFFATQKILEMSRGKNDVWNYGISGFFNGGWIGAGLGGLRRGFVAAFMLSSIGVAGKYMADSASESLNRQWTHVKQTAASSDPKASPRTAPTLKQKQIAAIQAREKYGHDQQQPEQSQRDESENNR